MTKVGEGGGSSARASAWPPLVSAGPPCPATAVVAAETAGGPASGAQALSAVRAAEAGGPASNAQVLSVARGEGPLGPSWRAQCEREQEAALPAGHVVVTCAAPLGKGGLGRHTQEILAALERRGEQGTAVCGSNIKTHPVSGPLPTRVRLLTALTPLARRSPGWRVWARRVAFDADAARRLPPADHLVTFNRQALAQMQAARSAGYESLALVAASLHVRELAERHRRAYRQYPLEHSFAERVLKRYLLEYAQAERIYVASTGTWESFRAQGVPAEKLARFPLTPDPRYTPPDEPPATPTFDVVYVGALTVAKGVPLLIDAVRRLPHEDLRLVLVGGWSTRGMRRFVEEARARDPRIVLAPGDPLPRLRAARLCAHPTYGDGFAYAPAEALACGVPVAVSEDTGMQDLIAPGRDGTVLPTGDLDAWTAAIDAAYRGELLTPPAP
jgi:glycosyltransferase involved in cell wall biosynthesis